ncbi:uncharacterized protein LOC105662410 [Megachile rotundata]|uniref:uncharacterized protein LOC105662410 n=1 Tax=Megachile rotundata TaxID=143995 RepID=UPI003FD1EFC7
MRKFISVLLGKYDCSIYFSGFRFRQDVLKYWEGIMEYEPMQWIQFILFKLHHLLRTHQRSGVITRIDKTCFTYIEEMMKCFEYRRCGERKTQTCRDCQIDPKPSLFLRGTYYERCEREIREIERRIKVGITPISRSRPYEENDKHLHKRNQLKLEAAIHEKYLTNSCNMEMKEKCDSKIESRIPYVGLYKEIKEMDYHLNQLRLKCPIHDPSL